MARVRTVPDRREAPTKNDKNEEKRKRETAEKPSTSASSADKKLGKAGHDELKHLQDSLSTFFTPTTGRRCRHPPKKFDDELPEGEKIKKDTMKPLTIDVSCSSSKSSQPHSKCSTNGSSPTKSAEVSPARRVCERLVDSLSPYFSVSSEKRRNGHSLRDDGYKHPESAVGGPSPTAPLSPTTESSPKKARSGRGEDQPRTMSRRDLKKVVGGRHTQNSASAALFGSQLDEAARSSSDGECPPQKKGRNPMKKKMIKNEDTEDGYEEKVSPPATSVMKERKKRKSITESLAVSPSCSRSGEKENFGADGVNDGQIPETEVGKERFQKAQHKTHQVIEEAIKQFHSQVDPNNPTKDPHWPLAIRLGKYEIKTWYSAPFPQEYADTPVLHICQFCLKYMRSASALSHHRKKCDARRPPGSEIYRDGDVSVYEVDGNQSRIYCQNLCLIAKLFLDHKTLYYDVEPFLFYVVTLNDPYGSQFVGYFSKEKYSAQKFNLSCIVTLPCYQKMGFGRFLIDFSFLLTRKEEMVGTPERPLSELGRISYCSYWRTAIFEWLHENVDRTKPTSFKLNDISKGTGITNTDIIEVLDNLGWFQSSSSGPLLDINWSLVDAQWKRSKADKSRIWLDPHALQWKPSVYSPSKDFGERSPVRLRTPHLSPSSTANVGSTPTGVSIAAVGSTIKKGCGPPKSSKKSAARRKLSMATRKEAQPTTSDTSDETDGEALRSSTSCKEPQSKRRLRPDSSPDPDGSESSDRKPRRDGKNGVGQRHPSTPTTSSRRVTSSRGKKVYEGDRSSSPSSSSSSDDDRDESFSLGGRHGKKPQKGTKGAAPTPRRRRAPPKKAGKAFPPKRDTTPEMSPPPRCDSAATSATVPMRQGEGGCATPGGGRTLNDVEDEPPPCTPVPVEMAPCTSSPPPMSQRASRNSHRMDPRSTTASSANNSEMSDDSRPHSPCSGSASNCSSPPIGGHEQHHMIMNMGGVPDDDVGSRCGAMSVESDQPPQLHAVGGTSSDEAPPHLPQEEHLPPMLSAVEGYNTDDDEAPPQLSPVVNDHLEQPPQQMQQTVLLTEEQQQQIAMDQPPKAPRAIGMGSRMEEDEQHISFDSAPSLMEPSSSKSMITQGGTPQNPYPGSMKQNTPGSVPSCPQMNQTTPEMQAPFLSPGMQIMQPTSVNSVHSMQNTSMDGMPPGSVQPFPPLSVAPQSDPSTPLRGVHTSMPSSFGSPPAVQQHSAVAPNQQMRTSVDQVPSTSNTRRSSEGSRKQRSQQMSSQQAHQQQQQQQALVGPQFPQPYHMPAMMNPYMQQYPGPAYQGNYFDPMFQAANPYWNYNAAAAQHYRTGTAAMGTPMAPAMMYPPYPNGMVTATAQQAAYRCPNPAAAGSFSTTTTPANGFNFPYANPQFFYQNNKN